MTLNLNLSPELAERLETFAKGAEQTPEQYALVVIERALTAWERAEKSLAPVRAAFEASGMSDDELSELVNEEIHAMRRERRDAEAG